MICRSPPVYLSAAWCRCLMHKPSIPLLLNRIPIHPFRITGTSIEVVDFAPSLLNDWRDIYGDVARFGLGFVDGVSTWNIRRIC